MGRPSLNSMRGLRALLVAGLLTGVALAASPGTGKQPFKVAGTFVEGCSCNIVCSCNMGHIGHACQGVGAMAFQSGTYMNTDLSGAKMAYAVSVGNWLRVYTEGRNPAQEKALAALIAKTFAAFGKLEESRSARIEITGADGKYNVQVDGGKIMSLTTEPVMGADGKKPFTYHNTLLPLSPTIFQAKTVSGSFNDGGHSFTLADSNSYFNPTAEGRGEL
jgi:hypothetical protein